MIRRFTVQTTNCSLAVFDRFVDDESVRSLHRYVDDVAVLGEEELEPLLARLGREISNVESLRHVAVNVDEMSVWSR